MARFRIVCAAVCGLVVLMAGRGVTVAASSPGGPQVRELDAMLAAFLRGDASAVSREFTQPADFQTRLGLKTPRELVRWLGPFDRGKAAFLLALARQAEGVAPHYMAVLLQAGRRYVGAVAPDAPPDVLAFDTWHRAAIGLLEGNGNAALIEEYADALDGARGRGAPAVVGRLALARALAQERRCWNLRPSLDQQGPGVKALMRAAGVTVEADLDGPRKASLLRQVMDHAACLSETVSRMAVARDAPAIHGEARVRGGWALLQLGRAAESLAWLEGAQEGPDRVLGYWRDLFLGRARSAVGRPADAAAAYRAALAQYPGAQAAGAGLALELLRLGRGEDADEVARAVRAAGAAAPDPWTFYLEADRRFVDGWIEQLRSRE